MEKKSGTQFDPGVTHTFARLVREGNIKVG
jgi:hypothetical protein